MNKTHKIVWNAASETWVAASEITKGHKKKSQKSKNALKFLTSLGLGALSLPAAYAASCDVSTNAQFSSALNNSSCDTIVLQNDLTLSSLVSANFNGRESIVIDGNGHNLVRTGTSGIHFGTSQVSGTDENLQFVMQNFDSITTSANSSNPIVWVQGAGSTVDVVFDNINTMPGNMFGALGTAIGSPTNIQHADSTLVIGTINNGSTVRLDTNKQMAQASKIKLTGKWSLVSTGGGSYARVFWSNSALNQNEVYFTEDARVSVKLASGDNFTSGGEALYNGATGNGYKYVFEDGAEFELWGQQNVFGGALPAGGNGVNIGISLGSYDKDTQTFGEGVKLNLAGVNGGRLAGHGVANLSGHASGIDNGPTGSQDVVFNLKEGSTFNVNGTGIYARKDAGNSSGIYIRSATDIAGATGIEVTHNGDGEVVVANSGKITGTSSGILLSSTSGNAMLLDVTGGEINMSAGAGIKVGTSAATGNANVTLNGGTINLTNGANGLDFSNTSAANQHTISNTVINLAQGATGSAFIGNGSGAQITVKNVNLNLVNGVGFSNINNINFAAGDNGERNKIAVSGSGVGVQLSKDFTALNNAELDILVTNAAGTGVEINGGTAADVLTVSSSVNIDATGATAIKVTSNDGRTLVNEGTVKGDVIISTVSGPNTITNTGTIDGKLLVTNGSTNLTLAANSVTAGEVVLSNSNNFVQIEDGASFSNITTGTGDDTFVFNGLGQNADTNIGLVSAGAGTNTLAINNSDHVFGTDTSLSGFSTINLSETALGLASAQNIQAGQVNIANDSTLAFSTGFDGAFKGTLSGAGAVDIQSGSNVIFQTSNAGFSGGMNIDQGGALKITQADQLGTGTLALNGTLDASGLTTLNHALTGGSSGSLLINSNGANFTLGSAVGDQYQGSVQLENTLYTLGGTNTTSLTNATLVAGAGSVVSAGGVEQEIGGLAFDGGTVKFDQITQSNGELVAQGHLTTNTIDASKSGVVQVDLSTPITPGTAGSTLMEMDDTDLIVQLASGATTGSAGNLVLQDANGQAITDAQYNDIFNAGGSSAAASGKFDYRLTTGENSDGLYLNYGLTELSLLGTGADALALDVLAANNGTNKNDLSAKITGSGDLAINSAAGSIVSLSNSGNDYTGATQVNSGTLQLAADSALGSTSLLSILSGAAVDLNGKAQSINTVDTVAGSSLNLNGGALTIVSGGSLAGDLSGAGSLTAQGGSLTVDGANTSLTASVQIDAPASITVNDVAGLGQSAVNVEGSLVLDAVQGGFANALSGDGNFVLSNSSDVELLQASTDFTGTMDINAGNALKATSGAQLGTATIQDNGTLTLNINNGDDVLNASVSGSGLFIKEGQSALSIAQSLDQHAGNVEIREGEIFVGQNIVLGQQGAGQTVDVSELATLSGAGTVNGMINNHGRIVVGEAPVSALITSRSATPSTAELVLNDGLQNYGSIYLAPTAATVGSKLTVGGDYHGHDGASVYINTVLADDSSATDQLIIQGHASGNTGLYVSNVGGEGSQTVQGIKLIDTGSSDAEAFELKNTLIAGGYEYTLYQNAADQDWYLSSYLPTEPVRAVRADAGVNAALQSSIVNTMVSGTQEENQLFGRQAYQDTNLWTFTTGGSASGRMAGHVNFDSDQYTLNVGADTNVEAAGEDFIVGVAGHYTQGSANAHNVYTNSRASGDTKGFGMSVHGTWFEDADKTYSPFVDLSVRYGHYENSTSVAQSTTESEYDADAWSVKVQGGYPIQVSENIIIEPQAQIYYVDYDVDSYRDSNGTLVQHEMDGNFVGRVGAYIYGADQKIQPYAGINVWYDETSSHQTYNNLDSVNSEKAGVIYDARLGLKSQINDGFSVWGEVNAREGEHDYQDWGVGFGLKYEW